MRLDLLELLAKKLETQPPFDLTRWVGNSWQGKPDLSCGTTACSLGHATTIPEIAALGLRLIRFSFHDYRRGNSTTNGGYVSLGKLDDDEILANAISLNSAAEVFGITMRDARYLFYPDCGLHASATALEAAAHIRRFISRKSRFANNDAAYYEDACVEDALEKWK
jgi:hypothetical protein